MPLSFYVFSIHLLIFAGLAIKTGNKKLLLPAATFLALVISNLAIVFLPGQSGHAIAATMRVSAWTTLSISVFLRFFPRNYFSRITGISHPIGQIEKP